jgi:hypothetical protein
MRYRPCTVVLVSMAAAIVVLAVLLCPAVASASHGQSAQIVVSDLDIDQHLPQVAYNTQQDEYLVVWHNAWPIQPREVVGQRIDKYGQVIDTFTIASTSFGEGYGQPAAAYDPTNDRYLVVYIYDVNGDGSDYDLKGRLIPWNGPSPSLTELDICTFGSHQWNPRVAFGGTQQELMVTWWNEEQSHLWPSYISAQRINLNGTLAGSDITVATGFMGDGEERVAPDIAYNQARNEHLIVYQRMSSTGNLGEVSAVRLNANGTILGDGELGIAGWPDDERAPRVGASRVSNRWFVVWQSETGALNDIYVRGVWVDGTGAIQMWGPVLLANTTINESAPDIGCYPEWRKCLITWQQQYSSSVGPYGIFGQTIDENGTLGDGFSSWIPTAGSTATCSDPAVGASTTGWLIAWERDRDPATSDNQDILARLVWDPFIDGFESGDTGLWSGTGE